MARASDGTYTAPSNSFNPAVEGTEIDEGDWNTLLADMVSALTDSVSRTGLGAITGYTDYAENGAPGTPAADRVRLYAADVGGTSALMAKDPNGNVYNLLLSASGIAFTFDTSTTTSSDPGSGKVRFNNATPASVTEIAIDDNDANGSDVSAYVLTWDDVAGSPRGTLIIQKRTSPGTFAIFNVTGASTDESGWTRLAVTHVASSGSLSSLDPLGVTFLSTGPAGATGATGAAGAAGTNGTDAGIRWLFDTSTTTNADPGSGDLRLNNATLASVTEIALSYSSGETGNPSVETFVKAWDDSTTTALRGTLIIKKASAPQNFVIYFITSAITDGTTYGRFTLSYVTGSGSFSAADVLSVLFLRTGDKGVDGLGAGDVVGPAASIDNEIVLFDSTTGKLVKRATTTGLLKAASGVIAAAVAGTDYYNPGGTDVALADGGTGASTAAQAATNLGLGTGDSPQFTAINIGAATDTTLARSGAGELTVEGNRIFRVGGADVPLADGGTGASDAATALANLTAMGQGRHTIWLPAAAMTSRTTNGAAAGSVEMTTNKNMFRTLDFDTTTVEYAQFEIHLPKSWNLGTVTFQPVWSHAATTVNFGVVFGLAGIARSDDDAGDVAFGTEVTSTDTGGTTNDIYVGPESAAITIGGTPAAGDTVQFQLSRVTGNGSDTMAIDARLHGIRLFYTTNAATDV